MFQGCARSLETLIGSRLVNKAASSTRVTWLVFIFDKNIHVAQSIQAGSRHEARRKAVFNKTV
ncbi:MAG TPA: hypothetical protein DCE31_05400 [Lautropia sp.]|nr:hypothetical protein [Lautropia sp.]